MVKDERKELISMEMLKTMVIRLEQELEAFLIANACSLILIKAELTYPCLNLDWLNAAAKLLEDKSFIVKKDLANLILKISVS